MCSHLDLKIFRGFWEGNDVVAGWDQFGGNKAHKRERVHPCKCNVCDKAFKFLRTLNQLSIWQHSGHVCVCEGCDKKFKTNNSINRHKKLCGCKSQHRRRACPPSPCGDRGGGKEKDGSVQLQEKVRHFLPSFLKMYYLVFHKKVIVYFIFIFFFFIFKVVC